MGTTEDVASPDGTTAAALWEEGERTLPDEIRDYIVGGAGREQAIARNRRTLDDMLFLPRAVAGVARSSAATELFGRALTAPVFTAPIGSLDLVQPAAAEAVIEATRNTGMAAIVGILTLGELSELPHLGDATVALQLYLRGDDDWLRRLVADAEDRGFAALCITVDSPVAAYRPRDLRNRFSHRKLLGDSKNVPVGTEGRERQGRLTWDRLAALRDMTGLPLAIKGLLRPEDARRAVDVGLDAVYVSNHGGRNLGATPAPIEQLPAMVAAIGGDAAVFVDGGLRDGEDVARALALGADAAGIGRAHALALAAGGRAGVEALLTDVRHHLETTMALLGAADVAALEPDMLLVPPSFGRMRSPGDPTGR